MTERPTPARSFIPAMPSPWVMALCHSAIQLDMALNNHLHIDVKDLQKIRDLPPGSGIILTPNHADEADPRLCMELARRCSKQFIFMGNREAFDELNGFGGWVLQRIGVFSVERGGHDVRAKQYALNVVKEGRDVLVIFPEGEIFYLNDAVQPFHSGAVDIGISSLIERRKQQQDWQVFIVPMAIKYRYPSSIEKVLEKRVQNMERKLALHMKGHALQKRLGALLSNAVEKRAREHNLQAQSERFAHLEDQVNFVKHSILKQIEQKYAATSAAQARTIDRAWKLGAELREKVAEGGGSPEEQLQIKRDIADLTEVAHMVAWKPQYVIDARLSNTDRLAEVVLKLEREIYDIKRPQPLAPRDVIIKLAAPMALSDYVQRYTEDPHGLRHTLSEELRQTIQGMIDEIAVKSAAESITPTT